MGGRLVVYGLWSKAPQCLLKAGHGIDRQPRAAENPTRGGQGGPDKAGPRHGSRTKNEFGRAYGLYKGPDAVQERSRRSCCFCDIKQSFAPKSTYFGAFLFFKKLFLNHSIPYFLQLQKVWYYYLYCLIS